MGTLYLVATPIGNLEDVTLRALRVLREVAVIAAEDTRHTRKLLAHYDIHTSLIRYDEHTKQAAGERALAALEVGDVALVSDAGTPGLSDPGYELVQQAVAAGFRVSPVPGPSAALAALVASGLPTERFTFVGYLPRRAADRRRALETLGQQSHTLVAFEAPHRLQAALADLEAALGPDRPVAVCRELTKLYEEIVRGPLAEVRRRFEGEPPRGEITLVIGGAPPAARWTEGDVRRALAERLATGLRPTEAARRVAAESGWPRRAVYRLTMEEP